MKNRTITPTICKSFALIFMIFITVGLGVEVVETPKSAQAPAQYVYAEQHSIATTDT